MHIPQIRNVACLGGNVVTAIFYLSTYRSLYIHIRIRIHKHTQRGDGHLSLYISFSLCTYTYTCSFSQIRNVACPGGNVVTAISLYIYIVLSLYIYVYIFIFSDPERSLPGRQRGDCLAHL